MLKRIVIAFTCILATNLLVAQRQPLTLEECLQKAEKHNPVSNQAGYLASSSALKVKNLNRNYLPEMTINGDAHYQSDVTQVPIQIPQLQFEALANDWYKVSLDVSQVIYDGSLTRRSKMVETLDGQINRQQAGIEVYKVKERVTSAFFGILALQEQVKLLQLHRETLQVRLDEVESGVRNGVILSSNADILRAEVLKIDQKIAESDIAIETSYRILSILTGEEIPKGTALEMFDPGIPLTATGLERLEFGLFSLQQQKTESMKALSASRLMPRLVAYGQAGYGRPGFDMLKNEFDDFYVIGARLSWNFWNWNKTRDEKLILDLNRDIILSNQDAFSQGLSIELERKRAEILKFTELIRKDEEIALIRDKVVESYASRLRNGVITSTEYITELNAASEARLNLKVHQVQLARAKYDYLATAGKL